MMFSRVLRRYEVPKRRALIALLRPGHTFLDIGANKGDFSILAASIVGSRGRVITIEPEPQNCHWIAKSIAHNGLKQVHLHAIALSDTNGNADFYIGEKSGWHSLVGGQTTKSTIQVETQKLDDFLERQGNSTPIDMIKIDVEGADLKVLRGAEKTLASATKMTILMDIHPKQGVDSLEVCAFLTRMGFDLFEERSPFDIPVAPRVGLTSVVAIKSGVET